MQILVYPVIVIRNKIMITLLQNSENSITSVSLSFFSSQCPSVYYINAQRDDIINAIYK